MIRYLTGVTQEKHRATLQAMGIGLIAQPGSYGAEEVARWLIFALDNGCFTSGENWKADPWLEWLATMPRRRCLWAVAPDVPFDFRQSLNRSRPHLETIRALGFSAALALQEGATPANIPWEECDAIFLGGRTEWKHSGDAVACVLEARRRGLPCHWGRSNSHKRLAYAQFVGCSTADGTFLRRAPDQNVGRMAPVA